MCVWGEAVFRTVWLVQPHKQRVRCCLPIPGLARPTVDKGSVGGGEGQHKNTHMRTTREGGVQQGKTVGGWCGGGARVYLC